MRLKKITRYLREMGSLEQGFLKKYDASCGETIFIRFDMKMLLDIQKEKVLKQHYTSIKNF